LTPEPRFVLPAGIDFQNILTVRADGDAFIDEHAASVFSLGSLKESNSSVAVLLTAWFRYAHLQGKSIVFVDVPVELRNIINLCELDQVLPLQEVTPAAEDSVE